MEPDWCSDKEPELWRFTASWTMEAGEMQLPRVWTMGPDRCSDLKVQTLRPD